MTPSPALDVRGLGLRLGGRTILHQVTFAADAGQITALLGPNGAGKTSIIRCCTGLLPVASGTVTIGGKSVEEAVAAGAVGLMPQSVGAWSGIRPLELLHHLAGLHRHPLPVSELAERLGIDTFAKVAVRRLSGGQQQVLNLAGAIIGRPALVHLDEPSTGLDPHVRREVWQLIGELRDAGTAVLLTTHAMDEAEKLADQVHILDRGQIVRSGTIAELTATADLETVFLSVTREGGVPDARG